MLNLSPNTLIVPSRALDFVPTVSAGLVFWCYTNSDWLNPSGTLLKNIAPGSTTPASIQGAPIVGPAFTSFHGGLVSVIDAIVSNLPPDTPGDDWTFGVVWRSTDSFANNNEYPHAWSNFMGGLGFNLAVYGVGTAGLPSAAIGLGDDTVNTSGGIMAVSSGIVQVANFNQWHHTAGTISKETGIRTTFDVTGGGVGAAMSFTTHPGVRDVNPTSQILIGATPAGSAGICDVAFAYAYRDIAYLIDSIQKVGSDARPYLATKGVTGF